MPIWAKADSAKITLMIYDYCDNLSTGSKSDSGSSFQNDPYSE